MSSNMFPMNHQTDSKKIEDYTVFEIIKKHYPLKQYISDLSYYGSHINKYIGKSIPKHHDCMNLDLLQHKAKSGIIRFSEVKHIHESLGDRQEYLLKKLANIAKVINACPRLEKANYDLFNTTIEVFVIYADVEDEYSNKIKIENNIIKIHDFVNDYKYIITDKKDMDLWLGLDRVDISKYKKDFNPYVSIRRWEEDTGRR